MRNDHTTEIWFRNKKEELLVGVCRISFKVAAEMVVRHRDFAIVVILLCNFVVDPSFSQTTGVDVEPVEYEAGGMTTTTDYGVYIGHSHGNGGEAPTTVGAATTVGGEVEVELEGVVSTTTAKPLPKPKKKTTIRVVKTTTARATVKPLASPTTATAANATTAATAGQESTIAPSNDSKAVTKQAETLFTTKAADTVLTTQPVTTTTTTTTPKPVVKITSRTHDLSIRNMLTSGHTCPKMDVATWENEVVIYDNNCAIIIRMNPQLRRPTVTFQAPYW